jgi:hypothetical protein
VFSGIFLPGGFSEVMADVIINKISANQVGRNERRVQSMELMRLLELPSQPMKLNTD